MPINNYPFIDGNNLHLTFVGLGVQLKKAIIITNDGDFDNLVKKLITVDKLDRVLAPSKRGCSHLLISAPRGRIAFLDEMIGEIEKY
jgi:hypothetical protein